MSTTWFIAKEYLKRLDINFEERGRKTFSLFPHGPIKTEEIEVFPGTKWITLTTRLFCVSDVPEERRESVFELLLKMNAKLVGVNFGMDKKGYVTIRNAIPVTGISYDAFGATYESHLNGIEFFHETLKPKIEG